MKKIMTHSILSKNEVFQVAEMVEDIQGKLDELKEYLVLLIEQSLVEVPF